MPSPDAPRAARVLQGGAAAFLLIGTAISFWLADQALNHPEIHASQLGNEAPLWIPSLIFVVVVTAAACYLFLRAAQRVKRGEDLFGQRHRRRPSDERASS